MADKTNNGSGIKEADRRVLFKLLINREKRLPEGKITEELLRGHRPRCRRTKILRAG